MIFVVFFIIIIIIKTAVLILYRQWKKDEQYHTITYYEKHAWINLAWSQTMLAAWACALFSFHPWSTGEYFFSFFAFMITILWCVDILRYTKWHTTTATEWKTDFSRRLPGLVLRNMLTCPSLNTWMTFWPPAGTGKSLFIMLRMFPSEFQASSASFQPDSVFRCWRVWLGLERESQNK